MESGNYLGLYFGKEHATAVGVQIKGHTSHILGAFTVSADAESEDMMASLVQQVATGCAERKLKTTEVVVALDCALFMQHTVQSEFKQYKQIATTVRFDTEEVLATDISNMAVAFQVKATTDHGTQLNVFTVDQNVLSSLLLALQSQGIDPLHVVPDISCLAKYITNYAEAEGEESQDRLYSVLSRRHGYFIKVPAKGMEQPVRAFMISSRQNRNDLLRREILTTLAASREAGTAGYHVFDAAGQAQAETLAGYLTQTVTDASWFQTAGTGPQALADEADPVDYAIAMGAAILRGVKGQVVDFRADFMPFQGKKMRLQGAVKWASVCVTILMLALGTYLQVRTYLITKDTKRVRSRIENDYAVAMPGKKLSDKDNPVTKLDSELRRLKANSDPTRAAKMDSVPDRFTAILKAINSLAQETALVVDRLDVSLRAITISGSTSTSANRLKFVEGIKRGGSLVVINVSLPTVQPGQPAKFSVTIKPNEDKKGG